jgi:DNA-binding transcriptional regulator YhcF (GntR family)
MSRKSSYQARALQYLEDLIKQRLDSAGPYLLPSLRTLAKIAGMSAFPITAAVKTLKTKGMVTTLPGRYGTWIAGHEPLESGASGMPRLSGHRSETMLQQIRNDIILDNFNQNTQLPSIKELCAQYNADFRTLKKAMARLVSEQFIQPYKRTFRISYPAPIKASAKIVLIVSQAPEGTLQFANTARGYEMVRALEK